MTDRLRPAWLFAICLMTSTAGGHGLQETNQAQASAERPKRFIDYFIRELNAKANIRVDQQNGYRYIESDGLADHATGRFPNSGNPHTISAQNYKFRVSLKPRKGNSPTNIGHNSFGVAINGVPFDPATAEYWNNDRSSDWNIEAMTGGINLGVDQSNAHVQPNGAYHYHSQPTGIMKKYDYRRKPLLLGYAADGFPVYALFGYSKASDANSTVVELQPSYRIKRGTRPNGPGGRYDGTYTRDFEYVRDLGDLDQCNGRTGVTPEYPDGTYYYVITAQFPSIPRCWIGSGDRSFSKRPGSGRRGVQGRRDPGGGRGPGRGGPPPQALSACSGRDDGASCSFNAPHGTVSGTCRTIQSDTACVPSRR